MSLRDRLHRHDFDDMVTPGTATTPRSRRYALARREEWGRVANWVRLALTAKLPVQTAVA